MDRSCLIEFDDATFRFGTQRIFPRTLLKVYRGEHLRITGKNGSGKTLLGKALTGQLPRVEGSASFHVPFDKIKFVSFSSVLKLSDSMDPYMQQRWNATHTEEAPLVKDAFWPGREIPPIAHGLIQDFGIEDLLKKRSIALSNGELRKMELIRALAFEPEVLIIDNAFTGLDIGSRETLHRVLEKVSHSCTLILISLPQDEVPPFIKKSLFCDNNKIVPSIATHSDIERIPKDLFSPSNPAQPGFPLVEMKSVDIRYGPYQLLKDINWTVLSTEHWALYGPNGSGKSTLLSLIIGDNPQAYACDIHLFGKKKGSGESIWDIQRNIGFISPELHQFTDRQDSLEKILIHDKIWLYKGLDKAGILAKIASWFQWFGLEARLDQSFGEFSSGEQRLILFIRTLLYPFRLLIADEPCQGLDPMQIKRVQGVFTYLAEHTDTASIFISHKKEELPQTTIKLFDLKKENKALKE